MIVEKGTTIKLLDHGYIKLVDFMGTDEGIIEAARMSTGRGFEGWEDTRICTLCNKEWTYSDERGPMHCIPDSAGVEEHRWRVRSGDKNLLDFLYRNKHMTPFEMCELIVEVYAPISVLREWQRHRTQSYNEFSARYSVMPNEHYVPELSRFVGKKTANKQESSVEFTGMEVAREGLQSGIMLEQREIYKRYENMINAGVPKEIARTNTPVSRYSKMRAKGNLRNFLGFCNLRSRPNAQYEIRVYSNGLLDLVRHIWPRTAGLFEEYDLYGVSFSRTELAVIRDVLGSVSEHSSVFGKSADVIGMSKMKTTELLRKITLGGKEIL